MIRIESVTPKPKTEKPPDAAAAVAVALSEILKILTRHELEIRALAAALAKLTALQTKHLQFSKVLSDRLTEMAKPVRPTPKAKVN